MLLMVFKFFYFIHLGYIGHMLPENLEIAYMYNGLLYMMGYFINFVSGIILDMQGMQYLIIVSLVVSLPLYLLGEWMHESSKTDKIISEVNNFCLVDFVIPGVHYYFISSKIHEFKNGSRDRQKY